MKEITIKFRVTDEQYNQYEEILADFDSNLQSIGVEDVDTREVDGDHSACFTSNVTTVEIDSELFFNAVSIDTKSWSFDYDDLGANEPVFDYIQKHYPNELKALEDGAIDYLEVYTDY